MIIIIIYAFILLIDFIFMLRISIPSPQMKRLFPLSLLSLMILNIQGAYAEEPTDSAAKVAATMPTIKIEAMSELDPIKSYIDYDKANVTRNGLDKKIFLKPLIRLMFRNIKFMDQMI